jgi:diguanylate cyclase (GGDEF)-like protein
MPLREEISLVRRSIPMTKSLGVRLVVALAVMLLPLLILGASAFYSFNVLEDAFRESVGESLQEMVPLVALQVQVQHCRIALHHLEHEDSRENRQLFSQLAARVGETFAENIAFKTSAEKHGLALALAEWRLAERGAADLLALPGSFDSPAGRAGLARTSRHLDRVVDQLEALRGITAREVEATLERVETIKARSILLNSAVFLSGIGMVAVLGLLLARSILRPVRQLEMEVQRFAGGDLTHRLEAGRRDELGALMTSFNAMAAELEKERQALKELSASDPLTGLCNHREFFRLLREEMQRSQRYLHPLSLLMIDLDYFKQINDTFGHPAGDRVLCAVADILRRELRQVDQLARYGGEEFAAILPETAESEAIAIANRIRQAIAARPLAISETEGAELTISIGLAIFPDDANSVEGLVEKADQSLYAAKAAGRNRVCRRGAEAGRG